MKLLTEEILRLLPPLGANEEKAPAEVRVPLKLFDPCSSWTWYATEYYPEGRLFFGLVSGLEEELGYFSLDELESVRNRFGLGIERDIHWDPKTTLTQVQNKERR